MAGIRPELEAGGRVEAVREMANIALNKNTSPGDKSALSPGGVRMGAPALTSRGFLADDFRTVVDLFDKGVQRSTSSPRAASSRTSARSSTTRVRGGVVPSRRPPGNPLRAGNAAKIAALKQAVSEFASAFPTVVFD